MGTPVRSETATHQSWIATLLTSLANSRSWLRKSTADPARKWKTSQRKSNPVMPPLSTWSPPSPCASRPSPSTHPSVVSPSVTCDRLLPSVSSSPLRSPRLLARSPNPPPRPVRSKKRRVEMYLLNNNNNPFLLSALLFYLPQLTWSVRRFFELGLV